MPDGVYEHMGLRERGAALQRDWNGRVADWRAAFPALAEDWDIAPGRRRIPGWQSRAPALRSRVEGEARDAERGRHGDGGIQGAFPTMLGGAADLVESTKTVFDGAGTFARHFAGRNIPFGIREHAMGAIVNGLALHGGIVKPFGSTFLVFADYMRPAVRLSALMELPVVWVWTHDSIGVGEDGPTHQPVEQVMSLRAIPGLWVIRPADANETAAAWRVALERTDGPVALVLSRQDSRCSTGRGRRPGRPRAGRLRALGDATRPPSSS